MYLFPCILSGFLHKGTVLFCLIHSSPQNWGFTHRRYSKNIFNNKWMYYSYTLVHSLISLFFQAATLLECPSFFICACSSIIHSKDNLNSPSFRKPPLALSTDVLMRTPRTGNLPYSCLYSQILTSGGPLVLHFHHCSLPFSSQPTFSLCAKRPL